MVNIVINNGKITPTGEPRLFQLIGPGVVEMIEVEMITFYDLFP
jgi:hypothetical protein